MQCVNGARVCPQSWKYSLMLCDRIYFSDQRNALLQYMNFTGRRRTCNQIPKHAERCEFSDVTRRVMALYQECVLFDECQLCLVGHPRKKQDE